MTIPMMLSILLAASLSPWRSGWACCPVERQENSSPLENPSNPGDLDPGKWPGKDGHLKAGFQFNPGDYKPLKGWVIISDELNVKTVNAHQYVRRTLVLGPTAGRAGLQVEVNVVSDSIHDAHSVLADLPVSQIGLPLRRGARIGLEIGDISFVDGPVVHEFAEKATGIRFSRNNIVLRLQGIQGVDVAVVEVAREIDAKIRTEPGYTKAQLEALLPAISEFNINKQTVPRLSTAPVSLSATDPQGLPIKFLFNGDLGDITRDETVSPPKTTLTTFEKTGVATLTVWAIDRALLMKSATTSVTVIP